METQTRLSRHNKFISAENITILSVSSDDYLHAYIYIYITSNEWMFTYPYVTSSLPTVSYFFTVTQFSPEDCIFKKVHKIGRNETTTEDWGR